MRNAFRWTSFNSNRFSQLWVYVTLILLTVFPFQCFPQNREWYSTDTTGAFPSTKIVFIVKTKPSLLTVWNCSALPSNDMDISFSWSTPHFWHARSKFTHRKLKETFHFNGSPSASSLKHSDALHGFGVCFHSTNRIPLFFILLAVKVHFVFHFEYDSMSNYYRISVHRFIYCGAQRKSEIHWTIFCTHRGYFSICKCIFWDRRFALRRFHISTIWWMVFSSACLAFTWFEFLFSCRSSV